jgi:hypothetical protein
MKVSPPMELRRGSLAVTGLGIMAVSLGLTGTKPTHAREWALEQSRMPTAEVAGDSVTIRGVRNFRWGPGAAVQAAWETRRYDLADVESVWYVVTPFGPRWRGPAHAFVSFGFANGTFLSISVEARREAGESYSVTGGMLRRFELMYVIGDERDLIQVRANRDGEDVHVYPMRATPAQARSMFLGMLRRANDLAARPEFYGTLTNNCTTNLRAHVNAVARERVPFDRRVLLPGYSDELALRRGLIDTDLPLEEARRRFLVSERSRRHAGSADYSLLIRRGD